MALPLRIGACVLPIVSKNKLKMHVSIFFSLLEIVSNMNTSLTHFQGVFCAWYLLVFAKSKKVKCGTTCILFKFGVQKNRKRHFYFHFNFF